MSTKKSGNVIVNIDDSQNAVKTINAIFKNWWKVAVIILILTGCIIACLVTIQKTETDIKLGNIQIDSKDSKK